MMLLPAFQRNREDAKTRSREMDVCDLFASSRLRVFAGSSGEGKA